MSQADVESAQRGYDAFNRGDFDAVIELCAPSIQWRDPGNPDTSVVSGKEGVRSFLKTVTEPWENLRRDVEETVDLGDRVFVLWRGSGRGKGSGVEAEMTGADLLTFTDGKLVLWEAYADRAEARKAAGLQD